MLAKPSQPASAQTAPNYLQCGDATLNALIEIASAGLFRHFPTASADTTDIELVLDALRALRPKVAEIETLAGVLQIANGRWDEASRTLRDVIDAAPSFAYAKAMYAYCLASQNDAGWRQWADQALEGDAGPETRALVRALGVRADLDAARANHRGGEFVLPESYRDLAEEQESGPSKNTRLPSGEASAFASHAFLRA
ncbi:HrpB1 family type III secretion system apparatus protein [Paraburkholderia sp. Tr-20389]|uniref:HrpB1 family type III secretion system apparatus protein n=1 Tax=Paraburkholderia sp. Tr-20389 TaxID=2703903 RepID=UPI00198031D4|nr:HrpB1 family type III secretion system apparatus protein [Paraburkholderia sp. Tr-20389]MBN3751829.1 HrpB1 family type III secretion system apparatus protein [Paraburkholderia sp. Tr-20389]